MYDELAEIDWNGQENNTKRLAGLKVTYTGSEYGYKRHINSTTEFLSKVALYADTIILEDQIFHQLTRSPENVPMVMQEFYTIADFAIEYIALEELFSSNDGHPICTLGPPSNWSIEKHKLKDKEWQFSCDVTTDFANDLFSKNFSSIEDLRKFLLTIRSDKEFFEL